MSEAKESLETPEISPVSAKEAREPKESKESRNIPIVGQLQTWQVLPEHKAQKYIVVTLPFGVARKLVAPKEFDEFTNTGEQRELNPRWVAHLRKEILEGRFTPVAWSAGLRASHEKSMKIEGSTVTLSVNPSTKLPHLNGNHRGAALLDIPEKDPTLAEAIANLPITIQIFLDSKHLKDNFQNHQKGLKVSLSQQKVMKDQNTPTDPFSRMVYKVAVALHMNEKSHLYSNIDFKKDSRDKIAYKPLTSGSSSEQVYTVHGGAKIALAYEKSSEWLTKTYIEAYHAIDEFTEQDEFMDQPVPTLFLRGKILCPLGKYLGNRGGSILLVGVGNLLAFRKAIQDKEDATKDDYEWLAQAATDVFDFECEGVDVMLKRRTMGQFARRYFSDLVADPDAVAVDGSDEDRGRLIAREGIPLRLLKFFTPSSLGIKKKKPEIEIPGGGDEAEFADED